MNQSYAPIIWKDDKLHLLDQRLLPQSEVFVEATDLQSTALAIKDMVVRGAPCIGFTAIFGMALWVKHQPSLSVEECRLACDEMISARPTAVNLSFEVNRCFEIMKSYLNEGRTKAEIYHRLVEFGNQQIAESEDKNLTMAKIGVEELKKNFKVI